MATIRLKRFGLRLMVKEIWGWLLVTLTMHRTQCMTHSMTNDTWQGYLSHVWQIRRVSQVWHPWQVSHCDKMLHYGNQKFKKNKIKNNMTIVQLNRCDTMWDCDTSMTLKVVQYIGPSNDGRRHGRGTYLFISFRRPTERVPHYFS
jgi:hypothetical protein